MSAISDFAGAATKPRSYLSLAYVMARLPIGIVYLLLIISGLSLGIGALPVAGIGVVIFFVFLLLMRVAAIFERDLVRSWFGAELRPLEPPYGPRGRVRRLRDFVGSPVTWKAVAFGLIQVPVGWIVPPFLSLLLALAVGLFAAPFIYLYDSWTFRGGDPSYNAFALPAPFAGPGMQPATLELLAVFSLCGVVLAIAVLHLARLCCFLQVGLIQRLLGLSQAQLELAAARAEARSEHARADRSEQTRKEMVVNVSHELRTPIASIRGHIEALLDGRPEASSPADTRHYLEVVARETERLGTLVDDLLAVARADSGELNLDIQRVDVAAVARQVGEVLTPIARRERRVALRCAGTEAETYAIADQQRLAQVLMNLVRNAITHTPEGGIVSLAVAPTDGGGPGQRWVEIAVADTGAGIEPEELDRIFERFYRTDASRSRATGGFGLGLTISRDLVQAMGGSIAVTSDPGQGSRFSVRLRTGEP